MYISISWPITFTERITSLIGQGGGVWEGACVWDFVAGVYVCVSSSVCVWEGVCGRTAPL